MSKIALLGPRALVEPLSACGIDTLPCDSRLSGCSHLKELIDQGRHEVLLVTERLAQELPEELLAAEKKNINVLLLPDHLGSVGLYQEKLKGLIHD